MVTTLNAAILAANAKPTVDQHGNPATSKVSDYNSCILIVGPPGCGKTTLAAAIIRNHWMAYPSGVVFAHDPMRQFGPCGCYPYSDAELWRVAARKANEGRGVAMPRGASIGGSAIDVTKLALEVGDSMNRANNVRAPIRLVYDEISLLGTSGSTWVGALDNELLATRRHRGIGPVFNMQQPSQVPERFFEFSTDVIVYRTTRDRARDLEVRLLLEKGELLAGGVDRLERFQYIRVRTGFGGGITAEPLR